MYFTSWKESEKEAFCVYHGEKTRGKVRGMKDQIRKSRWSAEKRIP